MNQVSHLTDAQQRLEYWQAVQHLDRHRLKFCDEKLIKGGSKRVRLDPLTGRADAFLADPSDVVSAIGICGVAPAPIPMDYYIHTAKNDSKLLSKCIVQSVAKGFLRPHDVLVLDNKRIHRSSEVATLEEWLYRAHRISLVFLPARSTYLNPMKRLWKLLEMNLDHWNLSHPLTPSPAVAGASEAILRSLPHAAVYEAYRSCGY